jgi:MYXO-CTERM domain-containing protein
VNFEGKTMKRVSSIVIAAAVVFAAGAALAQPVRPNILLIFDTSGSMVDHDCAQPAFYKDGSPLCGGIGDGDNCGSKASTCSTAASATCNDPYDFTRRLFGLKRAIRDTLAQVGTDEVNFGLMRFPQLEDPSRNPQCPSDTFAADANGKHWSAHYFQDTSTSVMFGTDVNPHFGCRISTHNGETTADTTGWFVQDVGGKPAYRQSLLVDVTKRPAGVAPVASDFDPPGANIVEIYKWLDNQEAAANGQITDPELRAGNFFFTPLGRTLFYARNYIEKFVKPNDPKAGCRKNVVILITDGAETCDDATGPFSPFSNAAAMFGAGVDLYVLTDTSTGPSNDTIAFNGSGGKRPNAIRVALNDSAAVKQQLIKIIAESVPKGEICNGLDDNCNGQTDEAPLPMVGDQCVSACPGLTLAMVGKGICKAGAFVCDGVNGPVCQGCVGPKTEICNGIDDNCNGMTDEGFDLGKACNNGLKGACARDGQTVCKPDGSGVVCDAPAVEGTQEVCNNIDDDCDGIVDNPDKVLGVGQPCGVDVGMCMAGKYVCMNGELKCAGQTMSSMEVCDGIDNDCNGQTDEGLGGGACSCVPGVDPKDLKGECKPGTLVCRGNPTLACEGCIGPKQEICDGKDNDCNGMTDEGDKICQPGFACITWPGDPDAQKTKCRPLCQTGEFQCNVGFICETSTDPDFCRNARCASMVCPAPLECDEEDGQCKDYCKGVQCQAPKVCTGRGRCVDCTDVGCPTGQICTEGVCKVNPCATVTCGEGQYCTDGKCVGLCPEGCAAGTRCVAGACQEDACANVACAGGQVCDPADRTCKTNKCPGVFCPFGQRCVPTLGACKDDPCATTKCPSCYSCSITGDGLPQCVKQDMCGPAPAPTWQVKSGGGGGCACAVPGTPADRGPGSAALLALVVAGGLAVRRRRRR